MTRRQLSSLFHTRVCPCSCVKPRSLTESHSPKSFRPRSRARRLSTTLCAWRRISRTKSTSKRLSFVSLNQASCASSNPQHRTKTIHELPAVQIESMRDRRIQVQRCQWNISNLINTLKLYSTMWSRISCRYSTKNLMIRLNRYKVAV